MSGNQNEDSVMKDKVDKILLKLEKLDKLEIKIGNGTTQVTEPLALIRQKSN